MERASRQSVPTADTLLLGEIKPRNFVRVNVLEVIGSEQDHTQGRTGGKGIVFSVGRPSSGVQGWTGRMCSVALHAPIDSIRVGWRDKEIQIGGVELENFHMLGDLTKNLKRLYGKDMTTNAFCAEKRKKRLSSEEKGLVWPFIISTMIRRTTTNSISFRCVIFATERSTTNA